MGKGDGGAAAGTDEGGEDGIAERILGTYGDGGVAMLQLLGLKLGDGRVEVRIVVAQRLQLLGIMLVDLGLDGGGAGHGGLWSHQRGGRPKRMAGDLPERLEQGRTDTAVGDQPVEFLQGALLLGGHSRDRSGTENGSGSGRESGCKVG